MSQGNSCAARMRDIFFVIGFGIELIRATAEVVALHLNTPWDWSARGRDRCELHHRL